jgi:hypothetical protein
VLGNDRLWMWFADVVCRCMWKRRLVGEGGREKLLETVFLGAYIRDSVIMGV